MKHNNSNLIINISSSSESVTLNNKGMPLIKSSQTSHTGNNSGNNGHNGEITFISSNNPGNSLVLREGINISSANSSNYFSITNNEISSKKSTNSFFKPKCENYIRLLPEDIIKYLSCGKWHKSIEKQTNPNFYKYFFPSEQDMKKSVNFFEKVIDLHLKCSMLESNKLTTGKLSSFKHEFLTESFSEIFQVIETKDHFELVKASKISNKNKGTKVNVCLIDDFVESKSPELNDKKLKPKLHAFNVGGVMKKIMGDDIKIETRNTNDLLLVNNENSEKILLVDAKVINISFGFFASPLLGSYKEKEVFLKSYDKIFVFACGNDGIEINAEISKSQSEFLQSIGYELLDIQSLNIVLNDEKLQQRVIFVGSVMSDGKTISPFSNIPGEDEVLQKMTVFAPGSDIELYSPIIDAEKWQENCTEEVFNDKGNKKISGTSFATAFVTTLVGIILRDFPKLSLEEVVQSVKDGCVKPEPEELHLFGNGVIDFEASYEIARDLHEDLSSKKDVNFSGEVHYDID